MDRRKFIGSLTAGCAGASLIADGMWFPVATGAEDAFPVADRRNENREFDALTKSLLVDWCDGMIRHQIDAPDDPTRHGALACPACTHIHGRCSDALYPFLHLAHVTDDKKYLDAAINVYGWAENNVSQPDGSWANDINPKAWRGTSIFGAIALAEALHYHGEALDERRRASWMKRLDDAAGGYLYRDFKTVDFTNLNYGMTGVYGFHLFGRILDNQKYTDRSEQFSERLKEFFTEPNKLLWGEGKPNNGRSGRGLLPVDLGYNVEESLNGVVLYALEVNDTELLELLTESLDGHLQFMLPDGAWDNSWGTRSSKWSYWGSRTSDGCQPAFSLMAGYNSAFGTAAIKNAELLKRCTEDGLIHGGPHFVSHGVKPCIHHTFAHAKVMALVQDKMHAMPKVDVNTPLPRSIAQGVKHFPELDVWLAAKGPWRATVSAYDSIYSTKGSGPVQQPTGGALSVLYHGQVGTLLASSMARYVLVEPLNQQPQPGDDFPLTTRIETRKDKAWYSNVFDLKAEVETRKTDSQVTVDVKTTLQDEDRNVVPSGLSDCKLRYVFENEKVTIAAALLGPKNANSGTELVVPIVSPSGEVVRQVSDHRIEIDKPEGTVVVQANVLLKIKESASGRIFNMVPGMEVVPIFAEFPAAQSTEVRCEIFVV
ncbi:hypothetical protein [Rubripirellula reticaptiva]|uniref:Heparinase II/III-like protein n=1 Tax=Rubripirellula reticaptiva TaxID=2528013 RepID=A0A5C6EW78_9BACT|nr:hypothetical protein [Rubripirellula reticaptiva]TWU51729.1 hypothetical protein Poly59_33240 [Rubripirellula reticaptiva]